MKRFLLTSSILVMFAFIFMFMGKKAYAAGEFGNWGPNFNSGGYNAYTMGYTFVPKTNGNITQLWCAGSGGVTSNVRLWDQNNTTTPLASANIYCPNSTWVAANITPVAVLTSHTYRVAQYGTSNWWTNPGLNLSLANITILDGAYFYGGNGYPSSNGGGYIYGYADVTFASSAAPTISYIGINSVSANSISPYGSLNANGVSNVYYGVRYGASNTGNCSTLTSDTGLNGPVASSFNGTVYPTFSGLNPGQTYYFCMYAYNANNGTYTYSPTTPTSYTTTAAPPIINMYNAHTIDISSAVLAAGVNPGGYASTGYFHWGTPAQYTAGGSTCAGLPNVTTNVSTGSGSGTYYPVSAKISGLAANTTYYYCFQDTGSSTAYSAVWSFTTAAAATTGCSLFPGSSLASAADSTTVAGYLGSNYFQGTKIYQATVNGWSSANFHAAVDGQGSNIVLYRNSNNGKIFGGFNPQSWNSAGSYVPGAGAFLFSLSDGYKLAQIGYADYQTLSSSTYGPTFGGGHDIGMPTSTLNTAGVSYTNAWLDYESPSSKGAFTYLDGGGGSPSANNFTPNEIEVYKLSMCTVTGPTSVTTTGGTGVSENQATFNGTANPNSQATTGWFRYSTTNPVTCNDTFGTRLPASGGGSLGSGASSVAIPSQTTPATLTYNTTYYVCAIASNALGTTPASNVMQVITAPPPPTFVAPAPSATTVPAGNYTITWTSTAANGASYYPFRINDVTLNPSGLGTNYPGGAAALCAANAANTTNDVCYNTPNATTTTYSYTFTAGHTYGIWIHSFNSTTGAWSSARVITVTATYPLVVVKNAGSGSSGTVTSLDGNINCGVTCNFNYTTNASIKLTATPDSITQFLSWTGVPCTGPGESSQTATTCTFNAGSITGPPANTVTASFTKITYLLTVSKNGGSAGLGTGTVQSTTSGSPDGLINCGSTCTHTYDMNTLVTLKETPDSTATFAGWSGTSCTEGNNTSATCTFPMNAAKTVTANFNSVGYTGDVTFYFGSSNQTSCNPGAGKNTKPALEVVIVSGSVATPGITKYVFDPCSRVAGTLGASPAGAPYQGVSFTNKATVAAISHGLIMKVIPLYNSTIVGVQGTDVFPAQGKVIQSTGSAGDSARKVIYYESYPQIPNEVFPYSILSQ